MLTPEKTFFRDLGDPFYGFESELGGTMKKKIKKGRPVRSFPRRTRQPLIPPKARETMARRRKTRKGQFLKKVRRKAPQWDLKKEVAPVLVSVITEPILDQAANMLPINSIGPVQIDDALKIGIGYFFGKKPGLPGKVAKVYGILGLRNSMVNLMAGTGLNLGSLFGGQDNKTKSSGWV